MANPAESKAFLLYTKVPLVPLLDRARGQVDEKRPSRALGELPQVAATRTERRLYGHVVPQNILNQSAFG
jgi:hypothetical protein